jgi:hypothetical protein
MGGIEDQGERPAVGADFSGGQRQPHHLTPRELSWRPDPNSQSESAQHWQADNSHSRQEQLPVNAQGIYTVTNVDALSTIAERSLRTQGAARPSGADIRNEMGRIATLNQDAYPDLARNPDLVKAGMELRMNPIHGSRGSQIEIPPAYPQARPAPERGYPQQADPSAGPAAAPYDSSIAPQSDARPYYGPAQSPDAGQGIAGFFGSVLGGIGAGLLDRGLFGRNYGYPEYPQYWDGNNVGLDGYDPGLVGYSPGWGGFNHGYRPYSYGGRENNRGSRR